MDPGEPPGEPRARDLLASPDARFLDPARRWERAVGDPPAPIARERPEPALHVDPASWGAGFLAVGEREIPPELVADLRERVPQALLRDLHRVERSFHAELELREGSPIGAFAEAVAESRELRAREPVPRLEPTVEAVRAEQERRRALLAEPWQPALPDDAERRKVLVFPELD